MKSIRVKRLATTLVAPGIWISVSAHSDTTTGINEVMVTASPHGKSTEEIAGSINALDGEALQREVSATLGQTLQNQLGMSNSSFGPSVGLPVIRGLSGNRVEVLQNSNPLGDASATSPDHAIALEPILADRIEILRGPATLRFGPGAIGGVINILDNRIHQEPFDGIAGVAETRYDTNGNGRVHVGRLDAGNGTYNLHVSGVKRENNNIEIPGPAAINVDDPAETTHGFVANTDGESDSWSAGISRVTDNLVIGLGVSKVNNAYGIPPGSHEHGHDEHDDHDTHEDDHEESDIFTRIDMNQIEYSGKIQVKQLPGIFDQLDVEASYSDYEHTELEVEEGLAVPGTLYETDNSNLRLELLHGDSTEWLGSLGLQYSQIDFVADGEEAFVPPNQVETIGLFINEEREWGPGTLTLGVRYDQNSADPEAGAAIEHNLVNAALSYLYTDIPDQQIGIILSHSQRAPSAEELFANGEHVATASFLIGDSSLDREVANSLELTWRYTGSVDAKISLYHRDFSDFIYDTSPDSRLSHDLQDEGALGAAACSSALSDFDNNMDEFDGALPCYFYTQQDARFSGAEAEIETPIGDNFSLRLWGDTVRARLDDDGDVPRIPPARVGTGLSFTAGSLNMGLNLNHAFKQNRPGTGENATSSYTRLDANISQSVGNWTLFMQGNNLADEEIRNATSYLRELAPEPGRSIVLGLRYQLD
jgi:iron complex outermembrane recepter protein